jgi:hypothetical protein
LRGSTIGLDISDHFTSLCVLDRSGEVIEEARLRTIATGFSQRFSSMPPCRLPLDASAFVPRGLNPLAFTDLAKELAERSSKERFPQADFVPVLRQDEGARETLLRYPLDVHARCLPAIE